MRASPAPIQYHMMEMEPHNRLLLAEEQKLIDIENMDEGYNEPDMPR